MHDILFELAKTLDARKSADPGSSYVASLYSKGTDSILKKIGEEATEVVMAAKSNDRGALVHETADLWFHSLVLLSHMDLHPNDVLGELKQRYGRSGLEERASRKE